jgi:hypothetical protein
VVKLRAYLSTATGDGWTNALRRIGLLDHLIDESDDDTMKPSRPPQSRGGRWRIGWRGRPVSC